MNDDITRISNIVLDRIHYFKNVLDPDKEKHKKVN